MKAPRDHNSPFAPGWGLTDELRLAALAHADAHGAEATAEKYRIHPSCLSRWRRAYDWKNHERSE